MADVPKQSALEATTNASELENEKVIQEAAEQVEGTVRLFDSSGQVRKIPLPSNDPADPLTWPFWKRALVMTSLCVYGTCGFGMVQSTPLFFSEIIRDYMRETRGQFNPAKISQLASYPSVCMGVGNFLFVPLSMMLGRRAVFLFSNALMLSSIIFAAKSEGFNEHLAARCLQGLSTGVADALLPIMVLDMTFLHRRGTWMSFYWAFTAAAASVLLVIVPFAVEHAGSSWRTNYWFWSAFSGLSFLTTIFCLPETLYPRPAALIDGQVIITDQYGHVRIIAAEDASEYLAIQPEDSETTPSSGSFFSQLRPWKYQKDGFKKFYITTAEMAISLLHPSIFWVLLLNTLLFAGLVGKSVTYSRQLESDPWNFSPSAVGTAQAGSFFGALIALLVSGPTVDRISGYITKRNGGIREPEHLLPTFIIPGLCAFGGMVMYGVVGANPDKYHWIGIHISFALYYLGFVALSAITGVWIAEAVPHISGAALVLVCGGRNALAFPITNNISQWIDSQGFAEAYIQIGSVLLGILIVGGIPMYFFNKHIRRIWTQKLKIKLK